MNEAQRQSYLEAMDITVWVARPPVVRRDRLCIGPGSGSTLLICEAAGEKATPVAVDICRYLGKSPVWAWPDPDGSPEHPTLNEAIDRFLYTRVLVLGQKLAAQICKGQVPEILGSASIGVVPSLEELGLSPRARKMLWRRIRTHSEKGL